VLFEPGPGRVDECDAYQAQWPLCCRTCGELNRADGRDQPLCCDKLRSASANSGYATRQVKPPPAVMNAFPCRALLAVPLAGSRFPGLTSSCPTGKREEWKRRRLPTNQDHWPQWSSVPVEWICVRLVPMRCTGQGADASKLNKDVTRRISRPMLAEHNDMVQGSA